MEIIVSDNKQIRSLYNSDSFVIHSEYKGVFNKELAMSHFHKVQNFAQSHKLLGTINDLRKLAGSFNNVLEYLNSEGFPKVKKLGLKAEAFIISDDIIMNHLVEKLVAITKNNGIEAKIFSSFKEANTWMMNLIDN